MATPIITKNPNYTEMILGENVTLTVSVPPAPGISYQWMIDGVIIPSCDAIRLTISSFSQEKHEGSYKCIVSRNNCHLESESLSVEGLKSTSDMNYDDFIERLTTAGK